MVGRRRGRNWGLARTMDSQRQWSRCHSQGYMFKTPNQKSGAAGLPVAHSYDAAPLRSMVPWVDGSREVPRTSAMGAWLVARARPR